MTSPDQPGPPPHDARVLSGDADGTAQGTSQHRAGRSSLSRNKTGWLRITLAAIAAVGLSAALITVITGGGAHQTTSGGPAASSGSAVAPGITVGSNHVRRPPKGISTSKNEATSAARLAASGGALRVPRGMKSALAAWESGPGGKDLAVVSTRFGSALQAAGIRQYSAMRYACVRLARSVPTAQSGPQIPDVAMQRLYARALADLAKGAADCQRAVSSEPGGDETVQTQVNPTLFRLSMSELAAGARYIFRATAEIAILGRQHH